MEKITQWEYSYRDFDGQIKRSTAKVTERDEGVFYAQNEFGCGKDADSVVYWKPVKQALVFLMGHRDIIEYKEIK